MLKSPQVLNTCDYGQQQRGKKICWTLTVPRSQWAISTKERLNYRTEKSKVGERETELKRKG